MNPTPVKANWRTIIAGAPIWFEARGKWRAGIVSALGKNLKERTIVTVSPVEGGALIERRVSDLYFRRTALKGADIPAGELSLSF